MRWTGKLLSRVRANQIQTKPHAQPIWISGVHKLKTNMDSLSLEWSLSLPNVKSSSRLGFDPCRRCGPTTSTPKRRSPRQMSAKVLLVGDVSVGKTSYVHRVVDKNFRSNYQWTVGVDFALKLIKWSDDLSIKLQLWDIAGQERFTSMTRVYYKDAHACVIMFDLTQRNTFHNALKWKKDLDEKCTLPDGSPVPCVLLANKCDLAYREVEQSEIEAFCKEQDFLGWTETSVKDGLMIEESMRFLLENIVTKFQDSQSMSNTDLSGDSMNGSRLQLQNRTKDEQANKCGC